MVTPIEQNKFEYKILGSRFIGLLFHVEKRDEVDIILDKIKKDYPKATHYCYCYIIGGKEKSNDDGEPSGTAGKPMISSMQRSELNEALLVIVRYFGGTKLGAGRLERTYSSVANETIKAAELAEIISGKEVELEMPINIFDICQRILDSFYLTPTKKIFSTTVRILVPVDDKIINEFLASLPHEVKKSINGDVKFNRRMQK